MAKYDWTNPENPPCDSRQKGEWVGSERQVRNRRYKIKFSGKHTTEWIEGVPWELIE